MISVISPFFVLPADPLEAIGDVPCAWPISRQFGPKRPINTDSDNDGADRHVG